MLNRVACVSLAVSLCVAMIAPAQAELIGVTNGDFETYDGEVQYVRDGWTENGDGWYGTYCAKGDGTTYGTNMTEVLCMEGGDGHYVYQAIGVLAADMEVSVSGEAIRRSHNWETFGTLEASLWAGNVTAAEGSSLESLGAVKVAAASFTQNDLGLDTCPSSASWSADLTPTGGAAGQILWLQLASTEGSVYVDNISATATIPEPSTLTLLACGLVGLLAYPWRRRK